MISNERKISISYFFGYETKFFPQKGRPGWAKMARAFPSIRRWLVGCFGFNGSLRSISVYIKRGRGEEIQGSKYFHTTPIRTYCNRSRPLSYINQTVEKSGTESSIGPSHHVRSPRFYGCVGVFVGIRYALVS